jgi:type I restriction enzyme S subunit
MSEIPEGFKMTELGTLPEEWETVRLGDVAEQRKETINPTDGEWKYVGLEHIDPGEAHLKRFGFSNEVQSSKSKFYSGDILYGKLRPYLDKGVLVDFGGICSTDIIVIKPKENFNESFFSYLVHLNDFRYYATKTMTGVNHPRTSWRALSKFKIPLPPLPEQQKIASILSTVQTAKEKTEAVINAAKELKKSMMKHLFTYGPVPLKDAESVPLKETEIGLVPEDWEVVRLGDVFEFSRKTRNLKINNDDLVPFIPMELISEESQSIKSWEQKKYSEISSGSFVFKNDIIIAKITPSFENGKQAILDNLPTDFGYATTEIWALHPKNEQVITQHLYNYTKIHSIRMNLAGKMEGSTGRQRLPRHVLENLKIPLPPLPIQQKIASILSAIDQKIQAEENEKKALEDLFKSLLHNLMTAKIRVNHLEIKR